MSQNLKEQARDLADQLSRILCRDDLYPCSNKSSYGESCMIRVTSATTLTGTPVSFERADAFINMCLSCHAYWLSLRLSGAVLRLL